MRLFSRYSIWLLGYRLKQAAGTLLGPLTVVLLRALRLLDPDRTARFTGRVMQRIGPVLKEHRIGRENLAAAFPEKSSAEIDAILDKAWENLGMFAGEFAHLDRMWDYNEANPAAGRIDLDAVAINRFLKLRDDGKGALIFAAHLGNWELPALVGPAYGLDSAVVFRPPNLNAVAGAVERIRAVNMGTIVPTERDAPLRLARMLEAGTHAGMLVDQYYVKGVDVVFFGRKTKCNPLLARLAARVECPIHGVRVIRLPNHRFRLELSEEVAPVRGADGKIDVQGTMQAVTDVVEGWIREYPEQWLWLHRRWR
jgi:Kdo2-lipid IVA lauroyltransferase/acyltransferase